MTTPSKTKTTPVPLNPNQGEDPMTTPIPMNSSNPAPFGLTPIVSTQPSQSRGRGTVINGLVVLRSALTADADRSFELPSGELSVPELTEEIDEYLESAAALAAAEHAYHLAVEKERKLRESILARRAELKAAVAGRLGKHSTEMASYGFAPAKVRVVSPKALVLAAAKAKATRIARNTMGPKQRLAITGNVTGVTFTPVLITTTPSGTPSPGVEAAGGAPESRGPTIPATD